VFSFRHELRLSHQSSRSRRRRAGRAAGRLARASAVASLRFIFLFWSLCRCAAAGGAHSTPDPERREAQRKPSSRLKTHTQDRSPNPSAVSRETPRASRNATARRERAALSRAAIQTGPTSHNRRVLCETRAEEWPPHPPPPVPGWHPTVTLLTRVCRLVRRARTHSLCDTYLVSFNQPELADMSPRIICPPFHAPCLLALSKRMPRLEVGCPCMRRRYGGYRNQAAATRRNT
jgi:hypothetical protein